MRRVVSGLLALVVGAVACASPEDLDQKGRIGQPCNPNGTCDPGLACIDARCDLPSSGGAGGGIDSGSGGTVATGGGGAAGTLASGGGSGGTTPSGGYGGTTPSGGFGGTTPSGGFGGTIPTGGAGGTIPTGGSGGTGGGPPPPGNPKGCASCTCCDTWKVTWTASPGATDYKVIWKCSIFPEHVVSVGNVTDADLCLAPVGMCSGECANGVGYVQLQACDATGCSAKVNFPVSEIPLACASDCCC